MKMENNHMTPGTGEDSYARNSQIQALSIAKVFPVVREALKELYSTMQPKSVMIGELGCASGPNALMLIPEVMDITYETYRAMDCKDNIPEIKVFLNDLHANDFNTVFMLIPNLYEKLEEDREGDVGPCFISATPGSFHKRVFPTNFLHFVHSSNSAHWLSQIPKGLVSKSGEPINKGNIYISKASPPEVVAAYQQQFYEDFTSFLESRGKEIVREGRMVLNIMASIPTTHGPQDYFMTRFLNIALRDMAIEGLIDEKKLDEFEIPFYPPTAEEVKRLIDDEGSFHLHKHEVFSLDWDVPKQALGKNGFKENNNFDISARANFITGPIKTGSEYMMASQFGEEVVEDLYQRVTQLVAKHLAIGKLETFHHAITLIKN